MYLLCLCSHVTNLVLMGTNQNACSNYSNACSNYSYDLKQSYFHEKRKKSWIGRQPSSFVYILFMSAFVL